MTQLMLSKEGVVPLKTRAKKPKVELGWSDKEWNEVVSPKLSEISVLIDIFKGYYGDDHNWCCDQATALGVSFISLGDFLQAAREEGYLVHVPVWQYYHWNREKSVNNQELVTCIIYFRMEKNWREMECWYYPWRSYEWEWC